MTTAAQPDMPLSTRMAVDLLRAWESGDSCQVETELQRSLALSTEISDVEEEERRHLLQAVAVRMRNHPNVGEPGDPALAVCARLLGHLVNPE